MSFFEAIKLEVKNGGKQKSTKVKLLDSINSEIKTIKDRVDTSTKDKEIRFYTTHKNPKLVNLKLKVRKLIFRFNGENAMGWEVENNIPSIVEKLKSLYKEIESIDESDKVFSEEMCGIS
jgi:hypothetical protein